MWMGVEKGEPTGRTKRGSTAGAASTRLINLKAKSQNTMNYMKEPDPFNQNHISYITASLGHI